MSLRIASYNMHGWNNGELYLNHLCDNNDVVFVTEHWLLPQNLSALHNCNSDFSAYAVSGITDIESFAKSGGRPYGGLGVLWSKNLHNLNVKVIDVDHLHRCLAIEIIAGKIMYICILVYLPVYENTDDYEDNLLFCSSFIDAVASNYVFDNETILMVCGDFNFDMHKLQTSKRLQLTKDVLNEFDLCCCDDLDINKVGYTYHHDTLGLFSLIDHVFIQKQSTESIIAYAVLPDGDNCSDHYAISITLRCNLSALGVNVAFSDASKDESDTPIIWNSGDTNAYSKMCQEGLVSLGYPTCYSCSYPCSHTDHKTELTNFANNMADVLYQAAKACFVSKHRGFQKYYWSEELNNLKQLSIASHKAWKESGSPRNGPVNDNRLLCKQRYKCAIREAKRNSGKKVNNKLVNDIVNNDQKSFWKLWNSKFNPKLHSKRLIENLSDNDKISQGFGDYFKHNFIDSGDNAELKNKFLNMFEKYCIVNNEKDGIIDSCLLSIDEVLAAILQLAKQKAPGIDKLCAEHLIYASNAIAQPLCDLFNACIVHGCVPESFATSIIVPVEKDKIGGANTFDNFRPISLVTMFSKVLEICLAKKLNLELYFDQLQYGFTRDRGCQKALLSVECIINYFNSRGSPVYMSALDASKAFDRVNHYSLFISLMNIRIPLPYLRIIIYWHLHLKGLVRWNGSFSCMFEIKSGIRQGGINSPGFFNIFINDLICKLRTSGYGCYISDIFCGCILFADDIILMSASLHKLQLMLNVCNEFAMGNDMKFNHLKSHLFQIGLSADIVLPKLTLGGNDLNWVNKLKYLGVEFIAGTKLCMSVDTNCKKFLGSAFAILQKCKFLSEEILCKIILTNCLPMLLYGVDSVFLKCNQIRKMSVAFNTVFRRIFHMSKRSSMRVIYHYIGTKTLDCIYEERLTCLIRNCGFSNCSLLRFCTLFCTSRQEFLDICYKYDVHVNMSVGFIKNQVSKVFADTVQQHLNV